MKSLDERITSLTDAQAGSALVGTVELAGETPDLVELSQAQERLIQALRDPDISELIVPGRPASAGDLARLALAHLAVADAARVERALDATDDRTTRDATAMLAIGALVLYAFSTELKIHRDPKKGWTFLFHKRPLKDSTVGKLLSELYNTYLGGPPPPAP